VFGAMNKPSTDYWASNLYLSPRQRTKPDQTVRDLPPRAAQRFKKAREELRNLRHVTEQVAYLGTTWKWVWMYEVGGRKLGYLHPSGIAHRSSTTPDRSRARGSRSFFATTSTPGRIRSRVCSATPRRPPPVSRVCRRCRRALGVIRSSAAPRRRIRPRSRRSA